MVFKYLLTLFMDDIGVIGSYLSYQWLIRLLCGYFPYTRRYPQLLRISLIGKYTINFCMLLIKHLLTRFFVLISSWRGYNILKGRSNSNFQNLDWIKLKVCNFFPSLFILYQYTNFYFLFNYSVINNQEAMSAAITLCNG